VVEKLIEMTPTEEYLKDTLRCITSSQYGDVVIERAIAKLCGYPLCSNALTAVPNQKYHISLKNKTVYDISERKNFCSNKCYSASKHLEKQIPSEPVWLREGSHSEPIHFMAEEGNKGCAGTVVLSGHRQQVVDEGQVVEMLDNLLLDRDDDDDDDDDSNSDMSDDVAHDSHPPVKTHTKDNDMLEDVTNDSQLPVIKLFHHVESVTSSSVVKDEKSLTQDSPSTDSCESCPSGNAVKLNSSIQFQRGLFKSCVVDVSNPVVSATKSRQSLAKDQSSLIGVVDVTSTDHAKLCEITAATQTTLERVKTCLYEWKTTELSAFLQSSCSETLSTGASSKLNSNEDISYAEDMNKDSRENSSGRQSECEKLYKRKVGQFYGIKPRVHFADSCKREAENDDKEIVLACVDSCSQKSLRRKIVLDKLSHVVPRLLEATSLHLTDVSTALRNLVHCFKLTSRNITLKSAEWSIVGYVVLRLLAIRDEAVHSALASEAATMTINKLLSSAAVTPSDIDEILCELLSQSAEASNEVNAEGVHN